MARVVSQCILCEKESEMTFVNKMRNDEERSVYRCNLCGHIQAVPPSGIKEDEEYYKANGMFRSLVQEDKTTDEQLRLKYQPWGEKEAAKIKQLINLTKEIKILEIGSGYGAFIEQMSEDGYNIDGIGLDEEKCKILKTRTGIQMKSYNILSDSEEMKSYENKYDLVCMFHVFEHVIPNLFLSRVKLLLKPGGLIFIEVPNENYYLKSLCKPFNDFSYLRAHISYFTPETLTYALNRNDFTDVKIYGKQLYSVENAISWIRNGVPVKSVCQLDLPEGLEFAEDYYKQYLEDRLLSDAIIAVGKKRN